MGNARLRSYESMESDWYNGSFFEPDVMLPGQFQEPRAKGVNGGERRLMAAMLTDAVDAYLEQATNYVKGSSSRMDAIEWIESDDVSYVFSFSNVCSALGINPKYLRMGLLRYVADIRRQRRRNKTQKGVYGAKGKGVNIAWKRIRRPRLR